MSSKQVVKLFLQNAFRSTTDDKIILPRELINIIFDYYYPALVNFSSSTPSDSESHGDSENVLNDICLLWITGKGFDRTHLYAQHTSSRSIYCDLRERKDFKSKLFAELFLQFESIKQGKEEEEKKKVKTDRVETEEEKEEREEKEQLDEESLIEFIVKNIQKYLDLPILYASKINIQFTETGTPDSFQYVDTKSPYLFSSDRRPNSQFLVQDLDDSPIDDDNNDGWNEDRMEERRIKKMKKEQKYYNENEDILRQTSQTRSVTMFATLRHSDHFTLHDILCACGELKPRCHGEPLKKAFEISGVNHDMTPILTVFFENDKSIGHIFYD